MNSFSLLIFAAAAATAVTIGGGSAVYPAVHHAAASTQYHSQDEWGQYAYGYSGGPSAKHEQRTADGVTRGGYSYVDANGLVQSVSYVSDPANGFRATGTNFPVNTVAAVPVVHHDAPAVPVVHPWPAVAPAPAHSWPVAAEPLPSVVDARHSVHYHQAAAALVHPTVKLARPLTPAGTANLHYPEHAVIVANRKKRSAGLYPLLTGYAAPAPAAHVVTVEHTEFVAPPASYVVPAPAATSYASVVRHSPSPAVVRHYNAAPAIVYQEPVRHVYAAPALQPVPYAAAAAAAVAVPVKTQYHSQDEHGQYTYGYTDGASAKTETRYADGVTKGAYSYVDDNGAVQAVHYTAGADGFRAAGTNIPVHHV